MEIGRHRPAQFGDAVRRRIAMMAVGQRLAAGLDDVVGGREIGLPDPEVDDRATLRRQPFGARQDLERRLGPEHTDPASQLQHCFPPGYRRAGK
jgi:hypothetical protein